VLDGDDVFKFRISKSTIMEFANTSFYISVKVVPPKHAIMIGEKKCRRSGFSAYLFAVGLYIMLRISIPCIIVNTITGEYAMLYY
jgi:hypothetical protein